MLSHAQIENDQGSNNCVPGVTRIQSKKVHKRLCISAQQASPGRSDFADGHCLLVSAPPRSPLLYPPNRAAWRRIRGRSSIWESKRSRHSVREFTRQSARTKEPAAHLKNIKPRHRDHYNTATSAIFILDFRAGCELWVFTTTKAEITAFIFFPPLCSV